MDVLIKTKKSNLVTGIALFIFMLVMFCIPMLYTACDSENVDPYIAARMASGALEGAYPALAEQVKNGCVNKAIDAQFCKDFEEVINPTITDALPMIPKVIDAVERISDRERIPPGAIPGIPEEPE